METKQEQNEPDPANVTSSAVSASGTADYISPRDRHLINEYKGRESQAFFAMVVIGLMLSSQPFFFYAVFLGIAIFGAFQLGFMNLLSAIALRNNQNTTREIVADGFATQTVSERANNRVWGAIGLNVTSNFIWWFLLVLLTLGWQFYRSHVTADTAETIPAIEESANIVGNSETSPEISLDPAEDNPN